MHLIINDLVGYQILTLPKVCQNSYLWITWQLQKYPHHPQIGQGKGVTTVPKGSTWSKEEAKQNWYVEFFFHNAETDKMGRFRLTKNLNRLKDPKEGLKQVTRLCGAYKIALEGVWSPIDEKANDKLKRKVPSLTLEAAQNPFRRMPYC